MTKKLKLFRLLGDEPSICVEIGQDICPAELELYSESSLLESVFVENTHHIFKVPSPGRFSVIAKGRDLSPIKSDILHFIPEQLQSNAPHQLLTRSVGLQFKVEEPDIKNVDEFILELKVLKNHAKNVERNLEEFFSAASFKKKEINLSSFHKDHPIHLYQYYRTEKKKKTQELKSICARLEGLDGVAYCSMTPVLDKLVPPQITELHDAVAAALGSSDTPDFSGLEGHLDDTHGMNIRNAWSRGITGQGVAVRHIDFGVYRNHEDFQGGNITVVSSRPETEDCNHGTASTGCIAAADNGFGVTGIAHSASFYFYDVDMMESLLEDAQPGDIVSAGVQFTSDEGLLPVLISKAWWDTIRNLTDKKVTVLMLAGNGGIDLSRPSHFTNYGDSGVLLVGACSSKDGHRLYFSNYGHPQSVINSWGEQVVTTGTTPQNNLLKLPGNNRNYTKGFNGTSSASPLCAGALTLLQCYAKKQGFLIAPDAMRSLISESTFKEGVNDRIGHRPNVEQLFTRIDNRILSSISQRNPFPASSNFVNYNISFDASSDDAKRINFDYRNTDLKDMAFVAHYDSEGPSELEWANYEYTPVKVPVTDAKGKSYVLYLRANKLLSKTTFAMNSAADPVDLSPPDLNLVLTFVKEDNKYLPDGRLKGIFPVYVTCWATREYRLPVNINIFVS